MCRQEALKNKFKAFPEWGEKRRLDHADLPAKQLKWSKTEIQGKEEDMAMTMSLDRLTLPRTCFWPPSGPDPCAITTFSVGLANVVAKPSPFTRIKQELLTGNFFN